MPETKCLCSDAVTQSRQSIEMMESPSSTAAHWVTQWSLVKSTSVNAGTRAHCKPRASQQNQDKLQAEMHWISWQEGWLSLGSSEKMPSVRCAVPTDSGLLSHQHSNPPPSTSQPLFSVQVANLDSAYGRSQRELSYKKVAKMQEKPRHCCFSNTRYHTMLHFTLYYIHIIRKIPAM